jgi:thioredoxin 1
MKLSLITALTVLSLAIPFGTAHAAQRQVFDQASFTAAQAKGERILVDISATWCPTCKAQKPIISSFADEPVNSDLVIFDVDFDSQKPVVRAFGAQMQSTLIAFKGKAETARSVGDTDPASLAQLIASNIE